MSLTPKSHGSLLQLEVKNQKDELSDDSIDSDSHGKPLQDKNKVGKGKDYPLKKGNCHKKTPIHDPTEHKTTEENCDDALSKCSPPKGLIPKLSSLTEAELFSKQPQPRVIQHSLSGRVKRAGGQIYNPDDDSSADESTSSDSTTEQDLETRPPPSAISTDLIKPKSLIKLEEQSTTRGDERPNLLQPKPFFKKEIRPVEKSHANPRKNPKEGLGGQILYNRDGVSSDEESASSVSSTDEDLERRAPPPTRNSDLIKPKSLIKLEEQLSISGYERSNLSQPAPSSKQEILPVEKSHQNPRKSLKESFPEGVGGSTLYNSDKVSSDDESVSGVSITKKDVEMLPPQSTINSDLIKSKSLIKPEERSTTSGGETSNLPQPKSNFKQEIQPVEKSHQNPRKNLRERFQEKKGSKINPTKIVPSPAEAGRPLSSTTPALATHPLPKIGKRDYKEPIVVSKPLSLSKNSLDTKLENPRNEPNVDGYQPHTAENTSGKIDNYPSNPTTSTTIGKSQMQILSPQTPTAVPHQDQEKTNFLSPNNKFPKRTEPSLQESSNKVSEAENDPPTNKHLPAVDTYELYILNEFPKLTLKYIHENDWGKFSIQNQTNFFTQNHTYPPKLSELSPTGTIYNFLRGFVLHMESRFQDLICFPNEDIVAEFVEFNKTNNYPTLPEEMKSVLLEKLQALAMEYVARNEIIKEKEHQGASEMIQICQKAFRQNSQKMLGTKYLNSHSFNEVLKQIYLEIRTAFLQACSFRHLVWKEKYRKELDEALAKVKPTLVTINENNRAILVECIGKIANDCLSLYNGRIRQHLAIRTYANEGLFNNVDRSAVAEAKTLFEQKLKEAAAGQDEMIISDERKMCFERIDEASNNYRMKIIEDGKKIASSMPPNRSVKSEKRSSASSGRPSHEDMSQSLLHQFVVVQIGLKEFQAGIFTRGTNKLKCVIQGDIYKYLVAGGISFNSKQLAPCQDAFLRLFLGQPIDTVYELDVRGKKERFRLEDFITRLMRDIKDEIKSSPHADGTQSRCIVCLPQCLNHLQRAAIKDGSTLAGFKICDIISDTNSMALAYLMNNDLKYPAKILSANFFDVSLDISCFTASSKEVIKCEAISGNFFISKPGIFKTIFWRIFGMYDELEQSIIQILKGDNFKGGNIILILSATGDADKIVSLHYPLLRNRVKKVNFADYSLKGAEELAKLITAIEENNPKIVAQIDRMKRLKESIMSHDIRDKTKSSNEPNGKHLSADAYHLRATKS